VQAERLEQLIDSCTSGRTSVIISSGGVSMGDRDLVKPLLERRGTVHCGRVLMKPGKPLTVATLDTGGRTVLFFGLPGAQLAACATTFAI
jgi:gephyrin